jgi:protein-S-isoprenylcysteine O-methyltransferase Ste14
MMIAGMVALLAAHSLLSASPIVITIQSLAVCLMIWARVTLGWRSFHAIADPTEGGIVTHGPYRFIRHPIYAAACTIVWAGVLAHWSLPAVLMGTLVFAGALVRMLCEEHLLIEAYPEYREYANTTKRMVPYTF